MAGFMDHPEGAGQSGVIGWISTVVCGWSSRAHSSVRMAAYWMMRSVCPILGPVPCAIAVWARTPSTGSTACFGNRSMGGSGRLERPFRLHLLPPAFPVQPDRHVGTLRPAQRQRPQRRWPAGCSGPPVIARYAKRNLMRFFRAAALAIPGIYERLEDVGSFHAVRLPADAVLREKIAHRPTRPVGRLSQTRVKRFYQDFQYQAASRDTPAGWSPGSNGTRVSCSPAWLHRDQPADGA